MPEIHPGGPDYPRHQATDASTSILHEQEPLSVDTNIAAATKTKSTTVSYTSLPKKSQLAILCLARLADPLAATSIGSYLFYQLKWFNPAASNAEIATQAGLIVGGRTAAQVLTGLPWGRLADSSYGGRKAVLVIGMSSSCIALVGYGLSTTFTSALCWQIFGGAMSSNVGIIRCVVAELNPEKKYRSRALLLLPVFASTGMFIGPLVGGFLSSKTSDGPVGGYPYAPPNFFVAAYYLVVVLGVLFVLEETLETHDAKGNIFNRCWEKIKSLIGGSKTSDHAYASISSDEPDSAIQDAPPETPTSALSQTPAANPVPPQRTPFLEIWTFHVFCTMLAHFIISGHLATFGTVWVVFMSTPVGSDSDQKHHSPLAFAGGLGLQPRTVGVIMSLVGALGVVLQLVIYPQLNDRFSTVRIWRTALLIFPLVYFLAPFPSLVALRTAHADSTSSGTAPAVYAAIAGVLLLFVSGRTGVTPATTLLINDCVPSPDSRGTINTAGTVVGNLSRSIFPVGALAIFGRGLDNGVVGTGFWCLAVLAVLAVVASQWVAESEGGKVLKPKKNDEEIQRPPA